MSHTAQLKILFDFVDSDNSGFVTSDEMLKFAEALSKKKSSVKSRLIEKLMKKGDENADEVISVDEFGEFFTALLRASFNKLDKDSNGNLNRIEVSHLVKLMLGGKPNARRIKNMVTAFDADENGVVDFDEFEKFILDVCCEEVQEVIALREQVAELSERHAKLEIALRTGEGDDVNKEVLDEKRAELEGVLGRLTVSKADAEDRLNKATQAFSFDRKLQNLVNLNVRDQDWKEAKAVLEAETALAQAKIDEAKQVAADKKMAQENFLALKPKFLKAFNNYDADGSGTIEYSEFSKLFSDAHSQHGVHLGRSETPARTLEFMNGIDKDDNSSIDFEEFWGYMSAPDVLPQTRDEFDNIINRFEDGWNIPMVGHGSQYW